MEKAVKREKSSGAKSAGRGHGTRLTTPDLVILSLLAERPMHGYEANATLENRKIRDWAAVSRPQIYYSLEKLTRLGFIRVTDDGSASAGPERHVFQTTDEGRRQLADALEAPHWTNAKVHEPFQTWLALSWQARPRAFAQQVKRRRKHLEAKLAEERATLADVLNEVGHPFHEAVWMLKFIIAKLELELKWLAQIERETPKRAPAKRRKR
jgi:DNA-binding PadR family transcriptional regulator